MQKLGPVAGQPTGAPFDMLLFGATGDLALRKLVPALYRRHLAGQIVAGSRVLAVARTSQSRETYLAQIEETCRKYLRPEEFSAERWKSFAALVDYLTIDATQAQDFKKLSTSLAGRDDVALFGQPVPTLALTSVQVEWRSWHLGAPDSDMHLFRAARILAEMDPNLAATVIAFLDGPTSTDR